MRPSGGVWNPGVGGTNVEVNKTDRQGAQLSQECPPPANYKPTGASSGTAQCLECARLFRLGLAVQVVLGPAKSFHGQARGVPYNSRLSLIRVPRHASVFRSSPSSTCWHSDSRRKLQDVGRRGKVQPMEQKARPTTEQKARSTGRCFPSAPIGCGRCLANPRIAGLSRSSWRSKQKTPFHRQPNSRSASYSNPSPISPAVPPRSRTECGFVLPTT